MTLERASLAELASSREALEAHSRARALAFPGAGHDWAIVHGRYLCAVDPTETAVGQWLLHDGHWEAWVAVAVLRELLRRPIRVAVDVGASFGYYTLPLAEAAQRAYGLEPHPGVAGLLRESVKANGLRGRCAVLPIAAGACGGFADLVAPAGNLGGASLYPQHDRHDDVRCVRVEPLDDVLGETAPAVDLVKIDAEGAERDVWRGMARIRANPGLVVFLEVSNGRTYDLPAFLDEIEADGWPLRLVAEDGSIADADDRGALLAAVGADEWQMLYLRRDG